jgi:hypothetical protein
VASLPALRTLSAGDRALAIRQDGVATFAQLASWGVGRSLVKRRVRSGQWQRVFPGVFALQSGQLSWRQRARAALLYAGAGAALSHESAAYVRDILPSPGTLLHVSVPHERRVARQPGLVPHRRREMPWSGGGLRAVDAEDAVLTLAAAASSDDELVGLLCDAVRAGVAPDILTGRVSRRGRMHNRVLLLDMLGTLADGIESPLELRYRRDVERAHGLPRAMAQKRERIGGRWIRADRVYTGLGVRVELDGQLAHPFGTTDDDVWRDNAVLLATRDITLRYRWRHVVVRPCDAALQVVAALRARGWQGRTRPCDRPECPFRHP